MRLLPPKATLVILTLAALMKAPDAMPAFKNYKVLDFNNIPSVLDFKERKSSTAPIDDEQLLVTGVAGNTLTVVRGYNGSTPAPHSASAGVYLAVDLIYLVIDPRIRG